MKNEYFFVPRGDELAQPPTTRIFPGVAFRSSSSARPTHIGRRDKSEKAIIKGVSRLGA